MALVVVPRCLAAVTRRQRTIPTTSWVKDHRFLYLHRSFRLLQSMARYVVGLFFVPSRGCRKMFVPCSVVLVMSVTTGLSEKMWYQTMALGVVPRCLCALRRCHRGIPQWHFGVVPRCLAAVTRRQRNIPQWHSGLSQDAWLHLHGARGLFQRQVG